jgi:aldehyde dehydrogenase (NAD+)|tara:strand:+ start:94 stop:1590 length:1497 start_codon:yes stop_codon:yes gene_type:complete
MIYKNFIGGLWMESVTANTFKSNNPAHTGQVVGEFQDSNQVDIDRAVEYAKDAFKMWSNTPAPKRAEIMFKAAQILERDKECIAKGMTLEMGKVIAETRGDVQEAIDMAYYAAGEGRRLSGETNPSELKDQMVMTIRQPMGVIGAITPWNFPIAIPSWKAFPALVAGNTMVIKPAEDTSWSVIKLAEVFIEAGLPGGVFNVVTGYGPSAGLPLAKNKDVKMLSFTGSTATGKIIATACAELGKQYSLEMGGKNGIIVDKDADLDLAVEGVAFGAFGTSGQRCTACSRVFIHEDVKEEFTEKLVAKAQSLFLGDGLEEGVEVGPLINDKALTKVARYVEEAKNRFAHQGGGKMLCGGSAIVSPTDDTHGYFFEPTIFDMVDDNDPLMQEEIFGPVVALNTFSNPNEAIWQINNTGYGLSAAIYTSDINFAMQAVRDVETGLFYVNTSCIGAQVHLPFGGLKGTGNGHRDAGQTMLDNCTEWKTVSIDFHGKIQKAQIDE